MSTIKVSTTQSGMTLKSEVRMENGVYVWNSNGRVPPADSIVQYGIDQLPGFDKALHDQARDEQTSKFLDEYRKSMESYKPSEEERFEMRAAFGPGVVVNVVTGKRYRV